MRHWDQMPKQDIIVVGASAGGVEALRVFAASLPADVSLVGVDEDTALVRFDASRPSVWNVLGRQGVSIITADRGQVRYVPGDTIELVCLTKSG